MTGDDAMRKAEESRNPPGLQKQKAGWFRRPQLPGAAMPETARIDRHVE
jgi:hypothetical protein